MARSMYTDWKQSNHSNDYNKKHSSECFFYAIMNFFHKTIYLYINNSMVIYETINKVNGKRYIGQDKNDDPAYLGSGHLLQKAIQKYGRDNFVKTILERCTTKEELDEREKYWIKITNAQKSKNYYNIVQGGTGGDNWAGRKDTPEYKAFCEKMKRINNDTKYLRTRIGHSEKTKDAQRIAASGRYTLPWFIARYGTVEGTRKYEERNASLGTRFLSDAQKDAYESLTKDVMDSHLRSGKSQTDLKEMYGISHKWLYKKYLEYYGTKSIVKIKRQLK